MRILLLPILVFSSIYAYDLHEQLDKKMIERLHIDSNKVTVVSFFAAWCSSCKKELPLINNLHHKLDHDRVEVIGIDVDKDISKAKSFQQDMQLRFEVINDTSNSIIHEFDPKGIPALYYIKGQKIVGVHFGAIDNIDEVIIKDLNAL